MTGEKENFQLDVIGQIGVMVRDVDRALAKGDLPAIPGVNRLEGRATVNGREAKVGTPVMGSRRWTRTPTSAPNMWPV